MNEIIIANNSLPQLCGCGLFAASESFIHTERVPDFCVLIYVIDGCISVSYTHLNPRDSVLSVQTVSTFSQATFSFVREAHTFTQVALFIRSIQNIG